MYYRPCPYCGAHLDPGESCDCLEKKKENNKNILAAYRSGRDGQMEMKLEDMMYYRPCPYCGAHLDPGESCDCLEKKKENNKNILAAYRSGRDGQMEMKLEDMMYGT